MSKTLQILLPTLVVALLGAYFFILRPQMQLKELAAETCDELDGAIVMVAGPLMNKAIGKAGRLGFEGHELGDAMREQCPGLMRGLSAWAEEHGRE